MVRGRSNNNSNYLDDTYVGGRGSNSKWDSRDGRNVRGSNSRDNRDSRGNSNSRNSRSQATKRQELEEEINSQGKYSRQVSSVIPKVELLLVLVVHISSY